MDKLPFDQLTDMLAAARAKVPPGSKWRHYKGTEYIVENAVLIEDANQVSVLYNATTQPDVLYVRPIASWLETLDWNGQTVPRFTKV